MFFSLVGIVAVGLIVAAGVYLHARANVNPTVAKKAFKTHIPRAISALILTAQFSELVKVVQHVSIVNFSAAVLLLAVLAATQSGTEEGIH